VTALVRRIMAAVDRNRDGRIDLGERALDPRFDDLLFVADVDGDGVVTLNEMVNEILSRRFELGWHRDD
jgi:Ca2+-binding EF-hand superfamily protein